MSDETPDRQYVQEAARRLGLVLDEPQVERVALALGRNAELARLVMEMELPEDIEPAAVFRL